MGLIADRLTKSTTQADYVRQQIAQAEASSSSSYEEEEPSWYESMANDVASIFNSDESIGDKLLDTASYAINGVGNGIQTVADAGVEAMKGGMGFVGNAVSDIGDWAYETGNKISAAYENPSFDSVWQAYDQGIAKPGMAIASTPFIPGQARAVAGALALPSVASGAINAFNEGDGVMEGTGNIISSFVVDPVSQLVKAASNPVETGQKIYEHPSKIWTDILEPGMVVEMPARGAKKAYDNRGEIKADYKAFREDGLHGVLDRHIDEGFKDVSHSLRSNIDDGSIREPYMPEESYSYDNHDDYAPEETPAPTWDIREDEYIGQPMPHGENGCVEAVVRLGQDNDFLGREYEAGNAYVPTLVEHAREEGLYEPFDPSRVEKGDVIVYDGDEHVVMADGEGGYVGNSSSKQRVVHGSDYNEMGSLTPTGLIKTGKGAGSREVRIEDTGDSYDPMQDPNNVRELERIEAENEPLTEDWDMSVYEDEAGRRNQDLAESAARDGMDGAVPEDKLPWNNADLAESAARDGMEEAMKRDVEQVMGREEPPADAVDYYEGPMADLPEYKAPRKIGPNDQVSREDVLERARELFGPVYEDFEGKRGSARGSLKTGEITLGSPQDIGALKSALVANIYQRIGDTGLTEKIRKEFFDDQTWALVKESGLSTGSVNLSMVMTFFNELIHDPVKAQSKHPGFTNILKKDPDLYRRVSEMADIYHRYDKQAPEARWGSGITRENRKPNRTLWEKIKDKGQSLYEAVFDDLDQLKAVDKKRAELKGVDGELPAEDSIYKLTRNSRGKAEALTESLIKGKDGASVTDAVNNILFNGKRVMNNNVTMQSALDGLKNFEKTPEGKAFMERGNFKDSAEALDAYLSAARFVELQKLDLNEVNGMINDFTTEVVIDDAGTKVPKAVLHLDEVDKAMVRDTSEGLTKHNPDYGKAYDKAVGETLGEDFMTRQTELPEGTFDSDPIMKKYIEGLKELKKRYEYEYAAPGRIADAEALIKNAPKELKEAAKKIYQLQDNVLRAYREAGIVSKEGYEGMQKYKHYIPLATDFNSTHADTMLKGKGIVDTSDNIKSTKAKPEGEKYKPIKSPLATIIGNIQQTMDHIVKNKIGQKVIEDVGKPNSAHLAVEVKGGPDSTSCTFTVYENGHRKTYKTTPEMYDILKSCETDLKAKNFALDMLKAGAKVTRVASTTNPGFTAANVMRDVATAVFKTQGTWKGVFNPKQSGYLTALKHILNHTITGKDKVMTEYLASGVTSGTMTRQGRSGLHSTIKKLTGDRSWMDKPAAVVDFVQSVNEMAETLPRLREYMRVKESGGSTEEAIYAARNVTMDFQRGGSKTKDFNQYTAFLNATIQGTFTFGEAMKNGLKKGNRAKFAQDLGGVLLLETAYWAYTRNQGWYQDRPDWEKQANFLFKVPFSDNIIRIPKAQEVGIFLNAYEGLLDTAIGGENAGKTFRSWAGASFDTIMPGLLSNAWVTPMELKANHSFFTGNPIIPKSLEGLPASEQVNDKASTFAKATAGGINGMTQAINNIFGSDFEGVSPLHVDHVGGNLGGAWYRGLLGAAPDMAMGKDKGVADILGFNRFKGNETSSQALNDYYDRREKLQKKYRSTSNTVTGSKSSKEQSRRTTDRMGNDGYNYKRVKEVDKAFGKINALVKSGKMTKEEAQKKKIQIVEGVHWK